MKEEWKVINGWGGVYKVSNLGRIKSSDRFVNCKIGVRKVKGKFLSLNNRHVFGYPIIELNYKGVAKTFSIHRLVALAFIPNPKNKSQVNHIDSNPSNNRVNNLEWVTPKENTWHSIKNKRFDNSTKRMTKMGKVGGDNLIKKLGSKLKIKKYFSKISKEYYDKKHRINK